MNVLKLKTLEDFKNTIFNILSKYSGSDFNLMIPGGSVLKCLDDDRYENLDTSQWKIFFCDERIKKEYSNFKAAKNFIKRIKGRVFPMISDEYDTQESNLSTLTESYDKILANNEMNVCLLGIGDNGHTCSLWPDSDVLDSKKMVEHVEVDCPLSPKRMTVTLEFLNKSVKNLYFVIPPKETPKKITQPADSILKRLKVEFTTIITEYPSNK